jgi:exodeoxyribonuclease V beta subunit
MVEIREAVARENAAAASWALTICSAAWMTALRGKRRSAGQRDSPALSGGDDRRISGYRPAAVPYFRRIWRQQPDTALLLIGDPKQAIYAFRGADIFTYMKARSEVAAHYTLDTNWRSSPGMVESVNRLFSLSDNPLCSGRSRLAGEIGRKKRGCALPSMTTQPAMNFWLMAGEAVGAGDYQTFMAQLCAAQIRDWLSAGSGARRCCGEGKPDP